MKQTVKLTQPQIKLLADIATAGSSGMVVPGTKGSTARVLRAAQLIEAVPGDAAPPRTRATKAGRARFPKQ
jgi:hypothetical protein